MSAAVSPVCGRACTMLSILTARTGPSERTGSPVNGEVRGCCPGTGGGAGLGVWPPNRKMPPRTSPAAVRTARTVAMMSRRRRVMTPPPFPADLPEDDAPPGQVPGNDADEEVVLALRPGQHRCGGPLHVSHLGVLDDAMRGALDEHAPGLFEGLVDVVHLERHVRVG